MLPYNYMSQLRQGCTHTGCQDAQALNTVTSNILANDQRDAQILFYVFTYIYNSMHVSSTQCSSSGETNCINTASGNSHSENKLVIS
jgi:hypothetical protein